MTTARIESVESPPEGRAQTIRVWWQLARNVGKERWGDPMGYLFILPGVVLFAIFQIWVLIRGLTMAFTDFRFLAQLTDPTNFVGLSNFVEAFTEDAYFWPSLGRALRFTAIYMPCMLGSSLLFASVIARVKNGLISAFFRTIMYLPVILPVAVAILMWKVLLDNQTGYVNHILGNVLGLKSWTRNWLQDASTALPMVAVMRVWKDAGYSAMLFLIGMYNINDELYEAASIDGAGGFRQWWYITLPLLKPVFTLVLVLNANLVSAAQEFMITYGTSSFGPDGSCLDYVTETWIEL